MALTLLLIKSIQSELTRLKTPGDMHLTSIKCFRSSLFLLTDSFSRDSREAIFSSLTSTLLFKVSSSIDSRALYRLERGAGFK